jgi:signal transduction histidine kinase
VSGGFGLVGLAERVRTLGGRLTAEPRLDGGFVVEAVLPG